MSPKSSPNRRPPARRPERACRRSRGQSGVRLARAEARLQNHRGSEKVGRKGSEIPSQRTRRGRSPQRDSWVAQASLPAFRPSTSTLNFNWLAGRLRPRPPVAKLARASSDRRALCGETSGLVRLGPSTSTSTLNFGRPAHRPAPQAVKHLRKGRLWNLHGGLSIQPDLVAPLAPRPWGVNELDFETGAGVLFLQQAPDPGEVGIVPGWKFFPANSPPLNQAIIRTEFVKRVVGESLLLGKEFP